MVRCVLPVIDAGIRAVQLPFRGLFTCVSVSTRTRQTRGSKQELAALSMCDSSNLYLPGF